MLICQFKLTPKIAALAILQMSAANRPLSLVS